MKATTTTKPSAVNTLVLKLQQQKQQRQKLLSSKNTIKIDGKSCLKALQRDKTHGT